MLFGTEVKLIVQLTTNYSRTRNFSNLVPPVQVVHQELRAWPFCFTNVNGEFWHFSNSRIGPCDNMRFFTMHKGIQWVLFHLAPRMLCRKEASYANTSYHMFLGKSFCHCWCGIRDTLLWDRSKGKALLVLCGQQICSTLWSLWEDLLRLMSEFDWYTERNSEIDYICRPVC